MLEDD